MPRRPRVFVEGGIYHVYNRSARAAHVFSEGDEAERFLELLRLVKHRDGWTVYAWCLMANHYHLALRAGPVPLARTIGFVQARFGQGYNRRWRSLGPLWQSRYKARLVEDHRYLQQLTAYVHLNTVAAGVVDDPSSYRDSGHRELLGRCKATLVDIDMTLRIYGERVASARRAYLRSLQGAREAEWAGETPGRVPRWPHQVDAPLAPPPPAAFVDELGGSTGLERPHLDAAEFIQRSCAQLGLEPARLTTTAKGRELSRLRYLVAALGVERWEQRAKPLADLLGRRPDVVTRWVRLGAALRCEDASFREASDDLDQAISAQLTPKT